MKIFNLPCFALMGVDVDEEYPENTECKDFLGFFSSLLDAENCRDLLEQERMDEWTREHASPTTMLQMISEFKPNTYEILSLEGILIHEPMFALEDLHKDLTAAAMLQYRGIIARPEPTPRDAAEIQEGAQ